MRILQTETDRETLDKRQNRLQALTEEVRLLSQTMPADRSAADPLLPFLRRETRPFKVGVTALVRARRQPLSELPALFTPEEEDPGEMETAAQKRLPLPLTRPRQIADLPALPAFLREEGEGPIGVRRGVAAHKALCMLNYKTLRPCAGARELRQEIQAQLAGFLQKRLLAEEEYALLDANALAAFFESEWGQGALQAETLRREWGFVLALPEEQGMLVQGVIDLCYLQDGEWVLVDYKTDGVQRAEELWPLYEAQTALYSRALVEITGKRVRSVTLYSLALGEGTVKPYVS